MKTPTGYLLEAYENQTPVFGQQYLIHDVAIFGELGFTAQFTMRGANLPDLSLTMEKSISDDTAPTYAVWVNLGGVEYVGETIIMSELMYILKSGDLWTLVQS